MFSIKLFYQVHKRLNEIFSPWQNILFVGKLVLICGDLCQLLQVRSKPVLTFNQAEIKKVWIYGESSNYQNLIKMMTVNSLNKIWLDEID